MTEQTKQAAIETKAEKPEFVLLKSGVMMIGDGLVGNKLAAIAAEMINYRDDHGLSCIVFRNDGFPSDSIGPMFGATYADTHSIVINMQHCWDDACRVAMEGDKHLSFLGILWVNVLSAIGHELDHMDLANKSRTEYEKDRSTEEGQEMLEEVAAEAAINMIVGMTKKFDLEIPAAEGLGWFGVKVMELFTNGDTKDLPWVVKARGHMENSVIYDEGEDKQCFSFRDFIKKAHASNKDGGWDQPTVDVNLTAHLDSGVVEEFKAEPVEEAKAETVDLEQTEVEEVMAAAGDVKMVDAVDADGQPTIEMVQAAGGQFVDAGVAAVGVDENDIQFTDQVEAIEVPAGETMVADAVPPTVAAVPLPEPVATQAAATVAAAVPPIQEVPTTYTPNTLTPEIMAKTIKEVWQTLYHHMFTKCGWAQNPQTGRFMFTNAAAVLEGVNIQHIIALNGADNFIMEYDTLSAEGQYAAEMCQGMIRGRTTSKAGLPSYSLYLNIHGQRIKRTFMPQNPEKRNAQNAYTKSADEAGGGHMIVWVFKDEAPDSATFSEKVAVTIKDNVYEVMS